MPFTYTFPFFFHVEKTYKRPYVLSVHDANGRLISRITQWTSAKITDTLNEPSELNLTVASSDSSVESLCGGNEIWVQDQQETIVNKFRIATGKTVKKHDEQGSFVSVSAFDYTSILGQEIIYKSTFSGTIQSLLGTLLTYQNSDSPITLGTVPSSIASLSRTITVEDQKSILALLNELADTLQQRIMFYVSQDRVLNFLLIDSEVDSGKRLTVDTNLTGTEVSIDWANWITRLYLYGGSVNDKTMTLSDGLQKWAVWKSSASSGSLVLDHSHSACSNPNALTGYDSATLNPIQQGDVLKFADGTEKEIKSVSIGGSSTSVFFYDSAFNAGNTGVCWFSVNPTNRTLA